MEKEYTKEQNNEFLSQCCYFWKYKGDMTNYCNFDLERLRKLHPVLYTAWNQYTFAEKMLDASCDSLYEKL